LSRCGKEYLSSYADGGLPFATWLDGVESRIRGMKTLPRPGNLLLLEKEEMKVCKIARRHYVLSFSGSLC